MKKTIKESGETALVYEKFMADKKQWMVKQVYKNLVILFIFFKNIKKCRGANNGDQDCILLSFL